MILYQIWCKRTYVSGGFCDCKLKGHISLGFGDDMGCEKYESKV